MNEREVLIRELTIDDMTEKLLAHFNRYQEVKKVWRVEDGKKVVKDISFTETWDEDKKQVVIHELRKTLLDHGAVFGAFDENKLIGFSSVSPRLIGENKEYSQLLQLHVSYDLRGNGIGKILFDHAAKKAHSFGAKKLYISAHSSIETIGFYNRMGCKDTKWVYGPQVELEPYDCQLEYIL